MKFYRNLQHKLICHKLISIITIIIRYIRNYLYNIMIKCFGILYSILKILTQRIIVLSTFIEKKTKNQCSS